jgi:thiamine-phosphate pyrophosphorylase
MLRYYITDRRALDGDLNRLHDCIQAAIAGGVEYIQIREKDLPARALLELTRDAVALAAAGRTRILVNERADVALAAGAHGVHLRSRSLPPVIWRRVLGRDFLIGVSCHTTDEVHRADGANLIVFGPVFESPGKGSPLGLNSLRNAVMASRAPVFALGGVSEANAEACIRAGAAGIAGIRLFQERATH